MPVRKASAIWEGNLFKGKGTVEVESGLFKGSYSFLTRFEDEKGTNPEELLGAAHAACYSMALSSMLGEKGYKPKVGCPISKALAATNIELEAILL